MFLLLSICASTPTIAQEVDNPEIVTVKEAPKTMQKGQFMVGLIGMGGFGGRSGSTNSLWSLTGQGGYFVANRLLVGVQFSYGEHNLRFESYTPSSIPSKPTFTEYHLKHYTPEVFTRCYFTDWKVKPFVQASAGWNVITGDRTAFSGLSTSASGNNFTSKAALGVSFKVGKRGSIDLLYSKSLNSPRNFGDTNGFRLGVSFLLR